MAGRASINGSGSAIVINQKSDRAVVNWNSFSIGQGASVTVNQPAVGAAILNRVTGGTSSAIAGSLSGTGQVYLVNPNGIAITSTGSVNVGGGFVASTLDIADDDFMGNRLNFRGTGAGSVVNGGTIRASSSGFTALLGGRVASGGTIAVPLGRIGLGSASQATLDLTGDGFLQVVLPPSVGNDDPLVQVAGRLSGARIELRAATVSSAIRNAVNVPGELIVRGAHADSGSVILDGGVGGTTQISGAIDATSMQGPGGNIAIGGHSLVLTRATLKARGRTGGNISIGGGTQGAAVLGITNANATSIDSGSTIDPSGTAGAGGTVTVWSNSNTQYNGTIIAQGHGSDGGNAEVSGHGAYLFNGKVNLLSIGGKAGNLLLDPYNVTISTASDANQTGFTPTGSGANINTTTLQNALSSTNVTVSAEASGTENGDITVSNALSWSANTTLELNAAGGIILNAGISNSGTGSGLTLSSEGTRGVSGDSAGTIASRGLLTVNVNNGASAGTIAGVISGTGSLLKAGAGTLTLSGANTYSGGTTISNGTFITTNQGGYLYGAQGNGYINAGAGTGQITLGDANTGNNAIAYYFLAGSSPTNNMLVSSNATGSAIIGSTTANAINTSPRGTLAIQRDITLMDGTLDRTSFTGNISGTGSITLATVPGNAAGRITFDNSTNSFVGTVTINPHTVLQTNAPNVFNNNNIVNNGSLRLRAYDESIGSLTGNGLVFNLTAGGAANLTFGANNASGTFNGSIQDGTTVIKAGTGAQILAGANTYTGSTIVNAGALSLTGSWNVGSATATASIASGAGFSGNGVITAATLSDSGGGTVNLIGPNMIGTLTTSGTIGAFTLANAQSLTTGSIASSGQIVLLANRSSSDLTLSSGAVLNSMGSNTAITLSAGRNFVNNAGPGALSAANGRWLVYSATPSGDTFRNLDSTHTAVWNTTYASSGGNISAGGNRYAFAFQPTLNFTSINLSKTYGTNDSADVPSAYTVTGVENGVSGAFLGDSASSIWSGSPTLASSGSAANASVSGSPYHINISAGSVSTLDNYAVAFNSAGQLTVNPAPLTLTYTTNAASSTYGAALSGLSGTVSGSGFVNGEGTNDLSASSNWGTSATASSNVGSYAIMGSGLSSSNYAITAVQASGNATAYTINPAALTISAIDASKISDASAFSGGNGLSYSGFVNGDSGSSLSGTVSYGGAAQGAVNAGSYRLTASGLSNSNYTITWNPGTLTIGKAALTISGNTRSATYNGSLQTNGYAITSGQLYGSDTVSNVPGLATGRNAGGYADNLSNATGQGLANYTITYTNGSLTVLPRQIVIAADPITRLVALANPPLTYSVGGQGLAIGDHLSGALTTSAAVQSRAGRYAITRGTLHASPNYSVQFIPGTLTIQPFLAIRNYYPSLFLRSDALPLLKSLDLEEDLGCITDHLRVEGKERRVRSFDPSEFCMSQHITDKRPALITSPGEN